MADKPYEERLGGSYVVDPKTGKAVRKEGPEPAPRPQPVEQQPADQAEKKGK